MAAQNDENSGHIYMIVCQRLEKSDYLVRAVGNSYLVIKQLFELCEFIFSVWPLWLWWLETY